MKIAKSAELFGFTLGFVIAWTACHVHLAEPRKPVTLRALYGLQPPKRLRALQTALVLVDFQDEFVAGRLPLPEANVAIQHARDLADWAHHAGIWLVMVKNVSARPKSPIFAADSKTSAFLPALVPRAGDFVLQKSMASAFTQTSFDADLHAHHIDTLIVGGFMTHLAVATTASDATMLGYHVVVAADATATRDLPGAGNQAAIDADSLQRAALDSLADRVADVMLAREIMALPVSR